MAQLLSNFGADLTGLRQGASCAAWEKTPSSLQPIRVCRHALARGRVFATGRAFTPFARASLYSKLVELAGGATGLTAVQASPEATAQAQRSAENSVDGVQALAAALNEPNGAPPIRRRPA